MFVEVLEVVDASKSRDVFVGYLLNVIKDLFVFKVSFPVEHVVVVFLIKLARKVSNLHHTFNTCVVALIIVMQIKHVVW